MKPQTATQIITAMGTYLDCKGNRIKKHSHNGWKRGCRCAVCCAAHEAQKRPRTGRRGPDGTDPAYDEENRLEVLEQRQNEAVELHQERLRAAYAALVARTPPGYRPASWEVFLLTQGSLSTIAG